MFVKCSNKVP